MRNFRNHPDFRNFDFARGYSGESVRSGLIFWAWVGKPTVGESLVYVCVFIGNIIAHFFLLNVDVVQCTVLFISQKLCMLSGFVCVHIRRSNLYLSHVYMDCCVVASVIIVACSLFLSMCLFVLVNSLLNAFAIRCG